MAFSASFFRKILEDILCLNEGETQRTSVFQETGLQCTKAAKGIPRIMEKGISLDNSYAAGLEINKPGWRQDRRLQKRLKDKIHIHPISVNTFKGHVRSWGRMWD